MPLVEEIKEEFLRPRYSVTTKTNTYPTVKFPKFTLNMIQFVQFKQK